MNAEDREVLQRLARVNQHLGGAVLELLDQHQTEGGLTPEALTALAEQMHVVVTDLHTLARTRATTRAIPAAAGDRPGVRYSQGHIRTGIQLESQENR